MINTYIYDGNISSFTYSRSLILNILFKELKTKEQSCLKNCNWIMYNININKSMVIMIVPTVIS